MSAAVLIAEVLGVVAMVVVHRRQLRGLSSFFTDRLREQDETEEARRVAAYKMAKANERTVARSDRAVRQMADQARGLHEDSRAMQERVERHFADPRVKRMLGEGQDGG